MEVIKNTDEMSTCNGCVVDRHIWAEVIINIGGMNIKLCSNCRKELLRRLVTEF